MMRRGSIRFEGVYQGNSRVFKISSVARSHGEVVGDRRCGNQAVLDWHGVTLRFEVNQQVSPR